MQIFKDFEMPSIFLRKISEKSQTNFKTYPEAMIYLLFKLMKTFFNISQNLCFLCVLTGERLLNRAQRAAEIISIWGFGFRIGFGVKKVFQKWWLRNLGFRLLRLSK